MLTDVPQVCNDPCCTRDWRSEGRSHIAVCHEQFGKLHGISGLRPWPVERGARQTLRWCPGRSHVAAHVQIEAGYNLKVPTGPEKSRFSDSFFLHCSPHRIIGYRLPFRWLRCQSPQRATLSGGHVTSNSRPVKLAWTFSLPFPALLASNVSYRELQERSVYIATHVRFGFLALTHEKAGLNTSSRRACESALMHEIFVPSYPQLLVSSRAA